MRGIKRMNSPLLFARWIGCLMAAAALLLPSHGQAPSSPPSLSQADLEKLLGPIALYPDPLLSIMLPAACYPLEIVEASRFVANTNNIPKIDDQSWDPNVKGVAKIPAALKKMNDDLTWTSNLGQAFLDQQKDVMDTIQLLRNKAQSAGTLKSSEQQIVIVTNMVVEKTVETRVVVVTNTVVQIEPANPQIVYVPQYVPSTVYYPPPTYNPLTPLITFGVGVAVGAIIANNCDWHYGGIYVGGGYGWGGGYHGGNNNININVNNNNTINNIGNNNTIGNNNRPGNGGTQWKPDTAKLRTAGAPGAASAYQSREARGWGGGGSGGGAANRATTSTLPGSGSRPANSVAPATRPNMANPAANRPATSAAAARPTAAPASSYNRSSPSAFSGMNSGAAARAQGNRGAISRGGGGGGARGGGGGGRRR